MCHKRPSLPTGWSCRGGGRPRRFGDPRTVGLILVQQPRGEDEKEARCGDHHWLEVLDIDVEVQGRPAGLPSRTKPRGQDEEGANAGTIAEPCKTNHGEITLDLSAAGRSGGRDDQGRQADRKTDRKGGRVGEGGTTGRGRPQQAR